MLKLALISYHKNLDTFCEKRLVTEYKNSVLNQTYKDFDVFEVCYGGKEQRIFQNSRYEYKEFPTFVHCMNYMLDTLFENGYDAVLNSNVDDKNSVDRIERQVPYLEMGYEIVSSNFALVREGLLTHVHHFEHLDIETELNRNHNILCHPVIAYSRSFWERHRYIPEDIPFEDMLLWKKAIKDTKMIILPQILLFQNLHSNSVCQSNNR